MTRRPLLAEAAPYYFTYIDQVPGDDPIAVMEAQVIEAQTLLSGITDEQSLHRYAPEKWSLREALNHISDTERAFVFRALWFARGFTEPLPGYDQDTAVAGAGADEISWAAHAAEFHRVRMSTLSLFHNLAPAAWDRSGIASGNLFTVRALAFIAAGHVTHHFKILRERYL